MIPGPKVEGARPVRTSVAGVGGAILPTGERSSVLLPRHGLLSAQLSTTAFPQRLNSAAKLGAAVPRILFSAQFGAGTCQGERGAGMRSEIWKRQRGLGSLEAAAAQP